MNAVKNAISIISARLRESQHRDRTHFQNRLHSPDRFFPGDDDFHMNGPRRSSAEGPGYGSRYSSGSRGNNYPSRSSGFPMESEPPSESDNHQLYAGEELVFRILCPVDKIDNVVGELSNGFLDLLQNEIGVNIDISEPITGSDEHVIIISSDEVRPADFSICSFACTTL